MTSPGRILRFGVVGVLNTGPYFLNCWFTFRVRPTMRKFLLFPLSNLTNLVATSVGFSSRPAARAAGRARWSPGHRPYGRTARA